VASCRKLPLAEKGHGKYVENWSSGSGFRYYSWQQQSKE
jgi:hypothetical protein